MEDMKKPKNLEMEDMKKPKDLEKVKSIMNLTAEINKLSEKTNNKIKGIESKEVISLEELVERLDIFWKTLNNNWWDISNLENELESLKNITKNYCEENKIDFVENEKSFKELEDVINLLKN